MVILDIKNYFSPLMYGRCEFDSDVKKWLDKNVNYTFDIKETYNSPMHMDSGSDPCRFYKIIFKTMRDAILFKTRWGVGEFVNDL